MQVNIVQTDIDFAAEFVLNSSLAVCSLVSLRCQGCAPQCASMATEFWDEEFRDLLSWDVTEGISHCAMEQNGGACRLCHLVAFFAALTKRIADVD